MPIGTNAAREPGLTKTRYTTEVIIATTLTRGSAKVKACKKSTASTKEAGFFRRRLKRPKRDKGKRPYAKSTPTCPPSIKRKK